MKKMIFSGWWILFLATLVWAQEKVETPVWKVGDKWVFTGEGTIEVVNVDPNRYVLKFSDGICIYERQAFNTIMLQKPSLNRINVVEGDKRTKYTRGYKKLLDFPLTPGKQWKDAYSSRILFGPSVGQASFDYSENFSVLGWEDIGVRAEKFKALRVEYRRVVTGSSSQWANIGEEIKHQYWYSPEVKYFVKCQYDKSWIEGFKEIFNWDLISFQLKK
jgi:hypothetical protein